jgi:hypothetical protein
MKMLRHHILAKVFTYLTCVAFLNMNFFLAEVVLLDFNNPQLLENIAGLITNSGYEEERDGELSGNDITEKGINLPENHLLIHHRSLVLTGTKMIQILVNHYPAKNFAETFTPPPEGNIFFA